MNTKQFFEDMFGEDQINFRCIKAGSKPIDANGQYNQQTLSILQQMNKQDYEVYFVPNSGGYKDADINKVNTVFIDLDCGRDTNKNYYSFDVVKGYKQKKLDELDRFIYKPSYVIETRNGFHCYWLVHSEATISQFKECEGRLISYFDADVQVKNPARLLRVPDTYWCKDIHNKVAINIIQRNDIRYYIDDLINSLPCQVIKPQKEKVSVIKSNVSNYSLSPTPKHSENQMLNMLKNRDIEGLQEILKPEQITVSSHEEVYDYLKKQELHKLLGVHRDAFKCIVHEDNNPSAGILINANTGHHIYNCQSGNCGFSGTIIQVTERLTGMNRINSLRFLRKVFRIEYAETDWQKEQKAILEENQRFIMSEEFKDFYPEVYKRVRNYIPLLYVINGFAKDHIITENFSDGNENAVFFISLSHIAKLMGASDPKRIGDKIGLFAYLGLINKLPEDQIPNHLLNNAKHIAAKKHQKNIVSFFSIPPYGDRSLSFSKKKAEEYVDKGFTMKGWSREMILRAVGDEEADRVYPQMKGKQLSLVSEEITSLIEGVVMSLVNFKGWTMEQEILQSEEIKTLNKKTLTEKQFKRIIGELLDKYGLERVRLNNKLKEGLGIDVKGHPFVIKFFSDDFKIKNEVTQSIMFPPQKSVISIKDNVS